MIVQFQQSAMSKQWQARKKVQSNSPEFGSRKTRTTADEESHNAFLQASLIPFVNTSFREFGIPAFQNGHAIRFLQHINLNRRALFSLSCLTFQWAFRKLQLWGIGSS